MGRRITATELQYAAITDIKVVEKVALLLLATILDLREGETIEFEHFTIHKADNYGTFFIDYNPQILAEEFARLLQDEKIPDHVREKVEYFINKWRKYGTAD